MINGQPYEEEQNGYDEYTDDDGSEQYHSSGRDRDRKHRHHRSSKRHHHRRKRSHSRSRSRERSGKVHINPNFAPTLGPTASSLLETNNILESEVVRLRNELSCTNIRIRALENELSNGAVLRSNLEQELSVSRMNCQKLQQASTKNNQLLSSVRTEAAGVRKEKDRLTELLKQTEMQLSANTEQVSFLTKRNETLGRKCEELVEKNKILREERDDAVQLVSSMKREVENMQANIDLRLVEYKRMEGDLATARERERMWKVEKLELERKLTTKDSLLITEKKKAEEQKRRDKSQLEALEKKLKSEQPGWEAQLGVEAVYHAVEVVKKEFGAQLKQLQEQMRPLKEQSSVIASYHMNDGRPARVLSAPPLPVEFNPPVFSSNGETHTKLDITGAPKNFAKPNGTNVESYTQNGILPTFTEQELIGGDDEIMATTSDHDPVPIDEAALLDD
ncbi:unnamed protein product [Cylicocyclus nassatus]|uniref:Uncharacterized protein n=1 Tax=Cylicocyclus nassatus TaxID=53992 RepID=A0AA36DNY1_CYLNA|nr:unnamed protein product [Cylicocyclus nassatus]